MRKTHGSSLGEVIREFMNSYHLDEKILQKQVIRSWPDIMGPMVAKHTSRLTIRSKVLYVRIDSAALRNELSFSREKILKALNSEARAEVLTDIVIH
jgi:hypothetical protein